MIVFQTGSVVSFRLLQTTLVANNFNNVKIIINDSTFNAACRFNPELQSLHEALYPYFKDKVNNVNNPSAYTYFIVELENGECLAIGKPWIDETSFKVVNSSRASIEISNFRLEWEPQIKDLLNNLGASYTLTLGSVAGKSTPSA